MKLLFNSVFRQTNGPSFIRTIISDYITVLLGLPALLIWLSNFAVIFGVKIPIFGQTGLRGLYDFGLITLSVAGAFTVGRAIYWCAAGRYVSSDNRDTDQSVSATKLSRELLSAVTKLHVQKDYVGALRFSVLLSRPLWLGGLLEERLENGTIMESCASHENRVDLQIQALIDDMGWTNYQLDNVKEAYVNIKHGVRLAKENKYFFWAAKGERHLAGLASVSGEPCGEIMSHLSAAKEYLIKLRWRQVYITPNQKYY